METKGLIDLSTRVKEAMSCAGYANKATLYNIPDEEFPAIFVKIQEMFDYFADFKPQLSATDKKQIKFLSKYITAELDETVFRSSPSCGAANKT
jgi:hypothetical protein